MEAVGGAPAPRGPEPGGRRPHLDPGQEGSPLPGSSPPPSGLDDERRVLATGPHGSRRTTGAGLLSALVAIGAGLLLGLWAGYLASAEGPYAALAAVLPLGIAGLLVVFIVAVALLWWDGRLVGVAFLTAAAVWLGSQVAPVQPGAPAGALGTGTVGTRTNPTEFWQGTVTCDWRTGVSTAVQEVSGFRGTVRDPATGQVLVVEGLDLLNGDADLGAGGPLPVRIRFVVELTAPDRRSGTVVMPDLGDTVIRWECSAGP